MTAFRMIQHFEQNLSKTKLVWSLFWWSKKAHIYFNQKYLPLCPTSLIFCRAFSGTAFTAKVCFYMYFYCN